MCDEFKAYHYEIVAGLETNKAAAQEQVVFDEHQKKTMEFIDRLGDLLAKPQLKIPSPLSTNNHLVDRNLDRPHAQEPTTNPAESANDSCTSSEEGEDSDVPLKSVDNASLMVKSVADQKLHTHLNVCVKEFCRQFFVKLLFDIYSFCCSLILSMLCAFLVVSCIWPRCVPPASYLLYSSFCAREAGCHSTHTSCMLFSYL